MYSYNYKKDDIKYTGPQYIPVIFINKETLFIKKIFNNRKIGNPDNHVQVLLFTCRVKP